MLAARSRRAHRLIAIAVGARREAARQKVLGRRESSGSRRQTPRQVTCVVILFGVLARRRTLPQVDAAHIGYRGRGDGARVGSDPFVANLFGERGHSAQAGIVVRMMIMMVVMGIMMVVVVKATTGVVAPLGAAVVVVMMVVVVVMLVVSLLILLAQLTAAARENHVHGVEGHSLVVYDTGVGV